MVDVRENRNNGNVKKQLGISHEIPSCFFIFPLFLFSLTSTISVFRISPYTIAASHSPDSAKPHKRPVLRQQAD